MSTWFEKARVKYVTKIRLCRYNGIRERTQHGTTNGLWHVANLSRGETVSVSSHVLSRGRHGDKTKHGEVGFFVAGCRGFVVGITMIVSVMEFGLEK